MFKGEKLELVGQMIRGKVRGSNNDELDKYEYCILYRKIDKSSDLSQALGKSNDELELTLHYTVFGVDLEAIVQQIGTNLVISESGRTLTNYIASKNISYIGQAIMYALEFKIENLRISLAACEKEIKILENAVKSSLSNDEIYDILEYRRKFTRYGIDINELQNIIDRLHKENFAVQLENSYKLFGQVETTFNLVKGNYEIMSNNILRDLDTYTSIVNNNIANTSLALSVVSIAGLALTFILSFWMKSSIVAGLSGGCLVAIITLVILIRTGKLKLIKTSTDLSK